MTYKKDISWCGRYCIDKRETFVTALSTASAGLAVIIFMLVISSTVAIKYILIWLAIAVVLAVLAVIFPSEKLLREFFESRTIACPVSPKADYFIK